MHKGAISVYLRKQDMQRQGIRPWLREQLAKGRLHITRAELRSAFPKHTDNAIKSALQRAEQDCLIAHAWQGFYLLLPPAYAKRKTLPPFLYIDDLMRYLQKPYCVALLNAAETYGAAHQKPMKFAVMTTNPPPRSRQTHGTKLEFLAKREFNKGIPEPFIKKVKVQTGYVSISSPEITALSLVQYYRAAGGMQHVLTVLEELVEACHFDNLPVATLNYFPVSCLQRLGFMLDEILAQHMQATHLMQHIQQHSSRRLQYVPLIPKDNAGATDRNSKWKIIINAQLHTDFDDT